MAQKTNIRSIRFSDELAELIDRQQGSSFTHLWEKGKPKKQGYQPVRRIVHQALPSIMERPEHVNRREEYGHWEIDLVVGRAKSKPVLLTMAERRSRWSSNCRTSGRHPSGRSSTPCVNANLKL